MWSESDFVKMGGNSRWATGAQAEAVPGTVWLALAGDHDRSGQRAGCREKEGELLECGA